nr:hypothetical protein [Tanacetum cinerariifolium]
GWIYLVIYESITMLSTASSPDAPEDICRSGKPNEQINPVNVQHAQQYPINPARVSGNASNGCYSEIQ